MFQFNADKDGSMKAIVMDANGRAIMKLEMSANKGINNGHIHMGDLPTGIYTLHVQLPDEKIVKKILIEQ